MNIEIMRNTLYKAYLDDFAAFCGRLGGTTGEVMGSLLSFEVQNPLAVAALRVGAVVLELPSTTLMPSRL